MLAKSLSTLACTELTPPALFLEMKSLMTERIAPSTSGPAAGPGTLDARGRGRGVDNRPAWMTKSGSDDDLPKKPINNDSVEGRQAEPDTERLSGLGRGRGVDGNQSVV